MAKKQYLICEPGGKAEADWFVIGDKEKIEEVLLDIVKTNTDPIDEIRIFEIIPVDFNLKVVLKPISSK